MEPLTIFGLQFLFSLLVYSLIAKWLVIPKLHSLPRDKALFWLILPHTSRHIGLSFLVPGLAVAPLDSTFSMPTAYGDLLSAILALLTIFALRSGRKGALALVWLFNVVGTVDLLIALSHPEMVPKFGAVWFIPTMLVPLLLVSHFLIFKQLLSRQA